jgi:hypothetical protein
MTIATIGYLATFSIETSAGSGTYNAIAEVTSITPPSDKIDIIEATHMTSSGGNKEFLIGLNDPGEAGFTFNFIASGTADTALRAWRAARAARACRITYPNGVTWTFQGILTGYQPSLPMNDKMSADVTIKVTGSTTVA